MRAGWVGRSDSVVVSCGFTVLVFMALACVGGPARHIGKIPGATLILSGGSQGPIGDDPDTQIHARGAMMGNVEEPERWHGDHDPIGPWPRGRFGHRHRGPFWMRRGNGGPLRRDPVERLAGGVAAGVAAWRGFNVTTVRIVFVLIALVTGGWFVPVYVAGWLFLPAAGEQASIGSKARSDARGIRLAIGLTSLLILVLLEVSALNGGWFVGWAWPQVFSVAGLALIWRNAPADEQATLRRLLEPIE